MSERAERSAELFDMTNDLSHSVSESFLRPVNYTRSHGERFPKHINLTISFWRERWLRRRRSRRRERAVVTRGLVVRSARSPTCAATSDLRARETMDLRIKSNGINGAVDAGNSERDSHGSREFRAARASPT